MPLLIHLCGLDRCGKSTVADMVSTELYHRFGDVAYRTSAKKPPTQLAREVTPEKLSLYMNKSLDNEFETLAKHDSPVILDRSWIGENVYGKLYRGRKDDYVFSGNPNDNVYVLFYDKPSAVLSRDDGHSTFKTEDDILTELQMFFDVMYNVPNVVFAPANTSVNEYTFHNKVTNMLIEYYQIHQKTGKLPRTYGFSHIASRFGFNTNVVYSKDNEL